MNLHGLKSEFLEYLNDSNSVSKKGAGKKLSEKDINIYEYSDEFEKFISEKYEDSVVSDADLSDISKMITSVLDDKDVKSSSKDKKDDKGDDSDIIYEGLEELFSDEDAIKELDLNDDGVLDEDEAAKFINFAGGLDEDEDNLTFRELLKGIEKLKDGSYKKENKVEDSLDNATSAASGTGGSRSANGTSGSNGVNAVSSNNETNTEVEKQTYDDMSLEDLKTTQGKQEKAIDDSKNNIKSYTSSKNNELEKAGEEFEKELSENDKIEDELKTEIGDNAKNITETKTTINEIKSQITQKETEIYGLNNQISTVDSTLSGLKAALANLASSNNPEQQSAIEAQRAEIQGRIESAENQKADLEQRLQTARDEKTELEKTLKENEEKLTDLEKQKTEIEDKIKETSGEDALEIIRNYDKKIKAIEDVFDKKIAAEEKNLDDAKTELDKINKVLNVKNEKQIIDRYKQEPDLFNENNNITIQKINDGNTMPYLLIGPENVDESKELPVLFYLHGLGSVGKGLDALASAQTMPSTIMKDWGLNGFNGYVVCPLLNSGNWYNQNCEKNLRNLYESVSSNHNINKDKVALAGASLGGIGALYMANAMSDIFSKAAALSPYNPGPIINDGMKIPTKAFVGSNDDPGSYNFTMGRLKNIIGEENLTVMKGSTHGSLPRDLLGTDSNGDGCSDILQWLFSDD